MRDRIPLIGIWNKTELREPLYRIIINAILTIVVIYILLPIVVSGVRETILMRDIRIASGVIVEVREDIHEGDHRADYTFRLPDGHELNGTSSIGDELLDKLIDRDLKESPYPAEIEYAAADPDLNRIKGTGLTLLAELALLMLGVGILVALVFYLCFINIYGGVREFKQIYYEGV